MAKKRGGNLPQTFPLRRGIRHRSREAQVPIYLGKFFRMFIYQNDWKVLPMAAVIAGLVSYVVRKDFFLTMEGTLKGAFALTCIAIWNGCFNSIQVICRERNIVKREHRSGMQPRRDPVSRRRVCAPLVYAGYRDYIIFDHLCVGYAGSVCLQRGTYHYRGHDDHAIYTDFPADFFRRRVFASLLG